MHGLTQIRNVFVFPEQHDIVLAGPLRIFQCRQSPRAAGHTIRPAGCAISKTLSWPCVRWARPNGGSGTRFFGCSLEPPANMGEVWEATLKKYGNGPRNILQTEMKKAAPGHRRSNSSACRTTRGWHCRCLPPTIASNALRWAWTPCPVWPAPRWEMKPQPRADLV